MAYLGWTGHYTRMRRITQLAFFAIFALLPALDLFRFDFIAGKLFVFRQQIWLDEWTLVWLGLMFGMWIIGAMTLVLGRVWCAWACPQMVFSELAHDIDALAKRITRKLSDSRRRLAKRLVSHGLVAVLSIVATALFMGYFAPLGEVFRRMARFDVGLWLGAIGVTTTILVVLDLLFVRETFCQSVCPYGLLQGVLVDEKSLHVTFDESAGACIDCGLCERVCNMEIDIRKSAFQMECTRCGNCIDVCNLVLAKKKRPGLLAYSFGFGRGMTWDIKRLLVAVSTAGFGIVFIVAVAMREPLTFHISPVYGTTASAEERVAEAKYLLRAANKGSEPVTVALTVEGLPADATVDGLADGRIPAGEERKFTISIKVPRSEVTSSVVPFTAIIKSEERSERFAMTFYAGGNRT
ncbi:MAG: 4Fe-4S binding protein [Acidobacteria bacterium]|nr:4Fe-4S binding protein [Acidobacteriota bacterium]